MLASLFSSLRDLPTDVDVYSFSEDNARGSIILLKFTHGIAIRAQKAVVQLFAIFEKNCAICFTLFLFLILFSKPPKRKSYQFHVVARYYIFTLIFMIEFLTISLLLIQLSGTYVRFRKQSRDDEVTERRGEVEEVEKEEEEANRFDSVTSQAKRTEDKRKNRASEGQKQHGSSSGSIEKRSIDPWYYADVHVSRT